MLQKSNKNKLKVLEKSVYTEKYDKSNNYVGKRCCYHSR